MAEDPRTWLNEHIEAGYHLREEARVMLNPGAAWCERADKWESDLIAGVEARSPRHVSKVRTVGDVVPERLPVGHVWFDKEAVGLAQTSTGEGLPGNNPLSRLSARIRRAEEVAALWEHDPPEPSSAQEAGRPPRDKPLRERAEDWAYEMKRQSKRSKRGVAREIAARDGYSVAYIEREARRVRREKAGKAGSRPFPSHR